MLQNARLLTAGRVFMASFALLFLLGLPVLVSQPHGPPLWAQVAAVIAPSAVYAWFWLRVAGSGNRRASALALASYVALFLALFYGIPHPPTVSGSFLLFAVVIAGAGFGWRSGLALLLGVLVLQTAVDLQQRLPHAATVIVADAAQTLLFGLLAVVARLLLIAYGRLNAAREEIERLAVTEERLRFARDLHDLLGQSLAVIVLKSEVVARALPPETPPVLREDLREVARVARRSLDEVREAVVGYRHASLEAELQNARTVLTGAGIGFSFEHDAGSLAPAEEAALSWALREAVTNVIKHSQARHCRVSLRRAGGRVRLEVTDDGRGARPVLPGNGLRGIRERAAAIGGEALAEATPEGFRTVVTVPA